MYRPVRDMLESRTVHTPPRLIQPSVAEQAW